MSAEARLLRGGWFVAHAEAIRFRAIVISIRRILINFDQCGEPFH
jgi:hypothetical protein